MAEQFDISEIAALARLEFSEGEAEIIAKHMERIAELCQTVSEIEVGAADAEGASDELRDDEPAVFDNIDGIISAAPAYENGYFTVPITVNKGDGK